MIPEVDWVLRASASRLLAEVAPALGDAYLRSNVEVIAALMAAAAEEYDRAAHLRVEENRAMRAIFADAAPLLDEGTLRARLAAAAAETDESLRVSDLNAANGRLRALLIELHALVEERVEDWAARIRKAVGAELRASAQRRALSFYPI
ncbi:MAG: hypothetical protein HYY35_11460 [Deltaproteobacteria bacterium]|nr:hypothetical protein [Deltaproteobacteria bacterium]